MKMLSIGALCAGDVLLCYEDKKIDPVGDRISQATASAYTHAAICTSPDTAAESVVFGGVRKIGVQDLVKRYDHVAVFRQPDAWCPAARVLALNMFVDSIIKSGAKYNMGDLAGFKKRQESHELSVTEQLEAFFSGALNSVPFVKGRYFCSELVADCFVAVGFIEPSAAILYKSNIISPGALGRDPTFGTFAGYISTKVDYKVPSNDEFAQTTTFDEIFGVSK